MQSNDLKSDLDMSLDVLVAKASLDRRLRSELIDDAGQYCVKNGISFPEGTQIVFTSPDSHLIIKEIPTLDKNSASIQAIDAPVNARAITEEVESEATNIGVSTEAEIGAETVATIAIVVT